MADRVGQHLGNYVLKSLLGQGGFADVYLGEHVYLKRLVAVKVLQMRMTKNELQEFVLEAQIIAALEHTHIVRVHDFGVDGDTSFLVMDYAPHGSLRQKHIKGTPLPPTTIIPYVKQVAAALQYAHDQKLIHRDIKPENMLLGKHNDVLVSDFGLAVVARSTRSWEEQKIAGTAPYMSPEHFRAKAVPASDQYSLAVAVYEWLTGSPPFDEGDFMQLGYQHRYEPVPPLREKYPAITVPPQLEQVVMKGLAKEPGQRFERIEAFANALEQALKPQNPVIVTPPTPPKPAIVDPSAKGSALWYNGLYRAEGKDCDNYLRFYSDGTVLSVSVSRPNDAIKVAQWFRKKHSSASQGKYKLDGEQISFSTRGDNVTVDYVGRLVDNQTIYLKTYSHYNGHRGEEWYKFLHISNLRN